LTKTVLPFFIVKRRSRAITPRQETFCQAYILTGSIRVAAIQAGVNSRSRSAPTTRGRKWLAKPQVQAKIKILKQNIARKEASCLADARAILRGELAEKIRQSLQGTQGLRSAKKVLSVCEKLKLFEASTDRTLPG
jgi:phage terminase small subunit